MPSNDIYIGFSNYREVNAAERKRASSIELENWGGDSKKYEHYRKEWKRSADEEYLPLHPLHVDIELSSACNLRCKMCAHGVHKVSTNSFMETELVKKILDDASEVGVYSVKFNWRGESTLNTFLPWAIAYAKQKKILEVQINTNGLPKKSSILIDAIKSGIDRMIFSVDGFSSETYEEIRIGGNYQKLINNIFTVLEYKKSKNIKKPLIRIQMVRTIKNKHEVNDFINFWQDKVDDVRVSDVMDRGQGNALSVGDQIVVGRRRCPQPFQRLVIAFDGRVSPCCADWNQEYILGDLNKESLMEIWNGEKINIMRKAQNDVDIDKINICKNCYVKESFIWGKAEK